MLDLREAAVPSTCLVQIGHHDASAGNVTFAAECCLKGNVIMCESCNDFVPKAFFRCLIGEFCTSDGEQFVTEDQKLIHEAEEATS